MTRVLTAVGALAVSGCVTMGSAQWFEASGREFLVNKASYDFNCSRDKIELLPLGAQSGPYLSIGARGCGRSATYVPYTGGWALDSNSKHEVAAAEPRK